MHNAERWVSQALDSVTRQTVSPHQILIIADSCTDRSVQIVMQSGLTVQLIDCSCRNAAAARNLGIREATGDAIAMLDADDYWLDHHLESARDLLERGNDVAYMSGFERIGADGRTIPPIIGPMHGPTNGISSLDYIDIHLNGFIFGHLTIVYRLDRLQEVGLFDEELLSRHDFDLWLRVIAGKTWCCEPQPTAVYRVGTPGAITGHLVRGNYCTLKAVLNSLCNYETSRAYIKMLRTAARRAMTTGLVNGTEEEYDRAKTLARDHLAYSDRLLFEYFGRKSGILSKLIQWKRALFNS